jgi:hypothetical protein
MWHISLIALRLAVRVFNRLVFAGTSAELRVGFTGLEGRRSRAGLIG